MFTHRSIGEYLTASALASKEIHDEAQKHGKDSSWEPVFVFLSDILRQDKLEDFIGALGTTNPVLALRCIVEQRLASACP
jgi:hypothetical protein